MTKKWEDMSRSERDAAHRAAKTIKKDYYGPLPYWAKGVSAVAALVCPPLVIIPVLDCAMAWYERANYKQDCIDGQIDED